jgi:hypothetical protein
MRNKKEIDSKAEEALAALLANTKRHQRKLSLVDIAEYLESAKKKFGGLNAVAGLIGLSPKMLKQFEAVKQLTPEVQKYFKSRKIDSVDIAVHLVEFSSPDQIKISKDIIDGKVDSGDVRAIKYLDQSSDKHSLGKIVEKVISSKNIKEYVFEYKFEEDFLKNKKLLSVFKKNIGAQNFRIEKKGTSIHRLIVNASGKKWLEKEAKKKNMTKKKLIQKITEDI